MTSARIRTLKRFSTPVNLRIGIIAILVILILISLFSLISNNTGVQGLSTYSRVEIQEAVSSVDTNREFSFPLKNSEGEIVSSIKYKVVKAELNNEILVKGKKASSIKGRTFLVVTLEITNDFDKAIEISSRDYIRLSVNGDDETKLAPDIHSDPVSVQAISTKPTKVAFPVNETDTGFKLQIGEINGNKETIELDLKYN